MNLLLLSSLATLVTALLVAIVSSVLTVRLSLKRFHAERWWESKKDAYSAIFEALHHMKKYCDKEMTALSRSRDLPKEEEVALLAKWKEGIEEISRATNLGSFIISNEAVNLLTELQKDVQAASREAETWFDALDAELAAIRTALSAPREIAKKDLGVS